MARWDTFTFRVNRTERRLIESLAEILQRSQSDAVRFVIVNAAKELQSMVAPNQPIQPGPDQSHEVQNVE